MRRMLLAALATVIAGFVAHAQVPSADRRSSCRLYHPSFNASATKIVAASDCEAPWGIYVMNADGTMPRRITPREMAARLPNWSPDGSRVVFQSNQAGNWEIYVVGADGTNLRRLTEHPGGDSSAAFSPDGKQILFTSDRGGLNELFLMPAGGGESRQITRARGVGFRSGANTTRVTRPTGNGLSSTHTRTASRGRREPIGTSG